MFLAGKKGGNERDMEPAKIESTMQEARNLYNSMRNSRDLR
jgi:hypothetical protein